MDFFPAQNKTPNTLIQKDLDTDKYTVIATKLCDKRKDLEDALQDTSIDPAVREEKALALIDAKQNLSVFGVSEIDYQAYLSYKENSSEQMELF